MNPKKQQYWIPLLLVLCFLGPLIHCFFVLIGPAWIHSPYYFVGYETGFGGRKLLGTVCSWFLPEFVRHRHLVPFILSFFVLLVGLFIVFASRVFNYGQLKKDNRLQACFFLFVVYMACPFSLLSVVSHLGWYADVYLYVFTMAFVFVYLKFRGHWVVYPLTALISILACLTHHVFCCLFFPAFVALFIYDSYYQDRLSLKRCFSWGGVCLLLFVLFVTIWAFSVPMDVDAVYDQVCSRTNGVCIKYKPVFEWLYEPNGANYRAMWEIGQFPARYYELPFVFLFMSPLIALFFSPWILAIRNAEKGAKRTKYLLMFLASTLLFFPIFIMATDYNRWWDAFFFSQLMLLLIMYEVGDELMMAQVSRVFAFIKEHWIVAILLIVYVCSIQQNDLCGIGWIRDIIEFK